MRQKGSFVSGALVLLASGIVVKLLGAFFKIPLTNLIGDSGMGLFSFAMQFFSLLFVVAAAGLPVAESHLVSETLALHDRARAQAIVVQAIAVFGGLAAALSVLLAVFAPTICAVFHEPDAVWCLVAIAPAVFLVTAEAALRGWYQGTGNMVPTAISQVAEAVGKLLIGLLLARKLLDAGYGISGAAVGAIIGVTCGELFAVCYMLGCARRGLRHISLLRQRQTAVLRQLFQLMVPVTLCAAVMTVSGFLDMAVIYRRLPAAGFSAERIIAAYGAYTGMALTLFNLPQSLSSSVAISVLPAISAAHAQQNTVQTRRLVTASVRLTMLVCLPCGAGLFALSAPLLTALFPTQPNGVQLVIPLLRLLGIAEPLVGLSTVTTAILQAFGRPDYTVYSMTVGCAAKFAVSYWMMGIPQYNMLGAPVGTAVCYTLVAGINLIFIARLMHWCPSVGKAVFRPLLASCLMAGAAWKAYAALLPRTGLVLAVSAAVLLAVPIYFLLLLPLRALAAEDVRLLPYGEKLAAVLHLSEKKGKHIQNEF